MKNDPNARKTAAGGLVTTAQRIRRARNLAVEKADFEQALMDFLAFNQSAEKLCSLMLMERIGRVGPKQTADHQPDDEFLATLSAVQSDMLLGAAKSLKEEAESLGLVLCVGDQDMPTRAIN